MNIFSIPGSQVSLNIFGIHRNRDVWEDPEVCHLHSKNGEMISEPRLPLSLNRQLAPPCQIFGWVGDPFVFYSSSLYPNVKFNDVTKHPKGFEKGI